MHEDRRHTRAETEGIIQRLRATVPGLVLRTTFIVGFPGETDDEFEERLAKLEKKASDAKQVREAKEKETDRRLASERESARGAGVGLQVAYMIMGVPLLFAGIGWLIDRWQGTGVFVGVGTLVGAVLGIVMTIYTLNKTNS